MQYTKQENSNRTPLNLSSSNLSKSLSGDALYKKMIDDAIDNTQVIGCFIAGTLVRVQRDTTLEHRLWKPIEDIQVGDMVLSRPEDGSDLLEYKPVLNTFKLEQKPIWLLELQQLAHDFRNNPVGGTAVIATANHPFWLCGTASMSADLDDLDLIEGRWTRLDQLENGDVIQSEDGYFVVLYATPMYQTQQAHIAWALDPHGDGYDGISYDLNKFKNRGILSGEPQYNTYYIEDEQGERQYTPYLTDVYNFEVQDFHTYFVDVDCFWVHNTNCGATTLPSNTVVKDELKKVHNSKQHTQSELLGCFIAGTLVRVQRDNSLPRPLRKPIEDIQVGDMVLSRPEDGSDLLEYKPVLNTFKLEQKPIWYLQLLELTQGAADYTPPTSMIATPNHPFWLCGKAYMSADLDDLDLIEGRWTRLDQLENGDVIQSEDGYFVVLYATQLYQTEQAHIAWALRPDGDGCVGVSYNLNEFKKSGILSGDPKYNAYYVEDEQGERQYTPYLTDVYNFEVQDFHTYFVGARSLWVHNTNCGADTLPNNTVIKQGQDVIREMEKTAKNVYSSSQAMAKDLPPDLKGIGVVRDIQVKSNSKSNKPSFSQGQQMGYGAFSHIDPITNKEMLDALSFGFSKPFLSLHRCTV